MEKVARLPPILSIERSHICHVAKVKKPFPQKFPKHQLRMPLLRSVALTVVTGVGDKAGVAEFAAVADAVAVVGVAFRRGVALRKSGRRSRGKSVALSGKVGSCV